MQLKESGIIQEWPACQVNVGLWRSASWRAAKQSHSAQGPSWHPYSAPAGFEQRSWGSWPTISFRMLTSLFGHETTIKFWNNQWVHPDKLQSSYLKLLKSIVFYPLALSHIQKMTARWYSHWKPRCMVYSKKTYIYHRKKKNDLPLQTATNNIN